MGYSVRRLSTAAIGLLAVIALWFLLIALFPEAAFGSALENIAYPSVAFVCGLLIKRIYEHFIGRDRA